ncbi:unnamed protein product, partial [Prorocentrum cordatum]
ADRFGVRSLGEASTKLIKRTSLEPTPDRETRRICRVAATPYEASLVSRSLGLPLHVACVEPRSELRERADHDHQRATLLWQSHVGPVVVWRPDSAPVSSDAMCTLPARWRLLRGG